MSPTTRAEASRARRQEILLAALDCFTVSGVEATTIDDIRARSGASVGSIYHHFGSKEKLAAALYLEALRDYQSGFLRELKRHGDAESDIRAIVKYHLTWVSKNANRARYLLGVREADFMVEAADALKDMNAHYTEAVVAWRQPYVDTGVIVDLPADLYRPLLVGPLHEFSRQWLAGRGTTTMKEAQRVLAEAVWQALIGREKTMSKHSSGESDRRTLL